MARVMDRIFRAVKPQILDLGPLCGATAVYLADRGARVSVVDFEPPPPTPEPEGEEAVAPPPVRIEHSDASCHLVLAWEVLDFTPPDRLTEVGGEIGRILVPGGWLLLYSLASPAPAGSHVRPARYRVVADDRIVREEMPGPQRRRWVHANRDLERALAPLAVQGIQLQRNQMRELVALKPRPKSGGKAGKES